MVSRLKYFLFFLSFMACNLSQNAVKSQEQSSAYIPGDYKLFEKDRLENFYLVDHKNFVIQFDSNGKELFRYSSNRYGDLKSIDVSNPQKILLFYNDFQTVVILDNTLSELDQYFLEELGFWNIQATALSNDNQLWIFDQNQKKLLKINQKGQILLESNTIVNEPLASEDITQMLEKNNKVYLNADGQGMMIFDNLASYITSYPEIKTESFQVNHDQIVFEKDQNIYIYNNVLEGPILTEYYSDSRKLIDFCIEQGYFNVLLADGIHKTSTINETK